MYRSSHNKVITSRFSVVNIDGTVVQFILSIIMPGSIDTLKAEFWFLALRDQNSCFKTYLLANKYSHAWKID